MKKLLLILILMASIAVASQGSTTEYTVTNLGTLDGRSIAESINDSGQIAGYYWTLSGDRPYLWENGIMVDLGILGGNNSYAYAINDDGQVVGSSGGSAFLWENGELTNLGGDDSFAVGINNSGQVIGADHSGFTSAVLWENGNMNNIGTLPGDKKSQGVGINNSGHVVGYSWGSTVRSFRLRNNVMTDLGAVMVTGINDNGKIIGYSGPDAFIWVNGTITDLGSLGGNTYAKGLNNLDQVVGWSNIGSQNHAFLWENGTLFDLNDLIESQSGWVLNGAKDINNSGQIVGFGMINGEERAFLLTPKVNHLPIADAGEDITKSSEEISTVIIRGTATDEDSDDVLEYRWLNDESLMLDWTAVGVNGECPLDLSTHSLLIGSHTLTLEVTDGEATSTDEIILRINPNSKSMAWIPLLLVTD
jgi:probable HAF family extracellular repeat protein